MSWTFYLYKTFAGLKHCNYMKCSDKPQAHNQELRWAALQETISFPAAMSRFYFQERALSLL